MPTEIAVHGMNLRERGGSREHDVYISKDDEMTLLIDSVVRRHMKVASGWAPDGSPPASVELQPGETIIGTYRNPPPWEATLLTFSTQALWLVEPSGTERILWRDITGFDPPTTKTGGDAVVVKTRSGARPVRIAGSYGPGGRYKDFLLLVSVLLAVTRSKVLP